MKKEPRLVRVERNVPDDSISFGEEITIAALKKLIREDMFQMMKFAIIATLPKIKETISKAMEQPPISYELVSTQEVMRRWKRSRTTIIKQCKEGRLNPAGKRGREFLFASTELVKVFGMPDNSDNK